MLCHACFTDDCVDSGKGHVQELSTTNEWKWYCPVSDARFATDGSIRPEDEYKVRNTAYKVLFAVREILNTPDLKSIVAHAKDIMNQLNVLSG